MNPWLVFLLGVITGWTTRALFCCFAGRSRRPLTKLDP